MKYIALVASVLLALPALSNAQVVPGGSDTQVQFNNGGVFAGDPNFTWSTSTETLSIPNFSNVDGGNLTFNGINNSGYGGGIVLNLSNAPTGSNSGGGAFQIVGGQADGSGEGSDLFFQSGIGGNTGNGGQISFSAGTSGFNGGNGGNEFFTAGNGNGPTSNGGNIILTTGTSTQGGLIGAGILTDPSGDQFVVGGTGQSFSSNLPGLSSQNYGNPQYFAFFNTNNQTTDHTFNTPDANGTLALGTGTIGNCAEWTGTSTLGDTGAPCGAGGGGAWPWSVATNFGVNVNATTTPEWLQSGVYASSTSQFDNSSTTLASIGTLFLPATNALLSTDANGKVVATSSIGLNLLSGTLGINRGGTGATSFTAGQLLAYNGTSFVSTSTIGNSQLANSSFTLSSGSGLSGGGAVALGSSTTLSLNLASANSWAALQQFANASSTLASVGTLWDTGVTNALLATDANGKLVATTSISANVVGGTLGVAHGGTGSTTLSGILKGNGTSSVATAVGGVDYEFPLTFSYPLSRTGNAIALSFGTSTSNTWVGTQTFASGYIDNASSTHTAFTQLANASTTQFTNTGSTWLTSLANSLLATDANGKVIATTSIGTTYLAGTLATINGTALTAGGSVTVSAASSTLLASNNTFSGTNAFNGNTTLGNATTTNLFSQVASLGTLTLGTLANSILSVNASGKVVATSSIGINQLSGTLAAAQGGTGLSSLVANQLLIGNATGSGWTQLATSSLGLTTSNVAEGTNLYFTNARADARINATSSIGTLTSAPNLATLSTSLTGILRASSGVLSTSLVNLGSDVTNTLPIANGGTGATSFTAGQLLAYNGTSFVSTSTIGNAQLANSAITINTSGLLAGGGTVPLGGSLSISCPSCAVGGGGLATSSLAAIYPLTIATSPSSATFSLAFGTTTANTWGNLQTFQNGFTANASSIVNGNLSVAGNGTFNGNILANAAGSSTSSPRVFGFSPAFVSGQAAQIQFGDVNNTLQNGWGDRMQLTGYWGIELRGNQQTSAPQFVTGQNTDASVSIFGTTGNSANILNLNNNAGTALDVVSSVGNLGLGTTTPGSLLSLGGIANFTAATSTFYGTGGINLTAGCFSVNGVCISGSSATSSGLTLASFSASAPLSYNNLSGAFSISQANASTSGFLASTDWATFNSKLSSTSLSAAYPLSYNPLSGVFSTNFSTTTNNTFSGTNAFNGAVALGAATTTAGNGINITSGCFSIGGVCVGGASATSSGASLTAANTWTQLQTFSSGFTSNASSIVNGNLSISGNGSFNGNVTANPAGSSTSSPRVFGFSPSFVSGQAAQIQFGDVNNTLQNGWGDRMQLTGYWGLELRGNQRANAAPQFVTGQNSDASVAIFGTSGDGSNILNLNNNAGTTLDVVSGSGNLGLGTTTPGSLLSLGGVANFTAATSTFYGTGGINLTAGCFSINGVCISGGGGGGGVSLSNANTWTALQTFANATSTLASISTLWLPSTTNSLLSTNGSGKVAGITTSAGLASVISDETGSGSLVFANSPTLSGTANFTDINATTSDKLAVQINGSNTTSTSIILNNTSTGGKKFEFASTGSGNTPGRLSLFDYTDTISMLDLAAPSGNATLISGADLGWASSPTLASGGADTGLSRLSAARVGIGNGTSGNTTGTLQLGGISVGTSSSKYLMNVGSSAVSGVVASFENSNGVCTINPTSGSVNCSSDQTLKKNVNSIDHGSALTNLLSLNPVYYNWNSEATGTPQHAGFIAQQVQQIFPDLVSVSENGTLLLNYAGFAPYLAASLEELDAQVAPLASATSSGPALVSGTASSSAPWLGALSSASATLQSDVNALGSSVVHVLQDSVYAATGVFGKVFAQEVHTDKLCVSDSQGETCVTRAQLNALLAGAAASAQGGSGGASSSSSDSHDQSTSSASSDSSSTPPVISINGDNPASVDIGSTYTDLGAQITGPTADLNLGISASVDGSTSSPQAAVQIDTSVLGTHTILYSATDQNGNTGTATRTVNVVDPNAGSGSAASSTDDSSSESTSTDATSTAE